MLPFRKLLSTSILISAVGGLSYASSSDANASNPTSAAQYFAVSPTVAAPGQFIQFSWRVSSGNFVVVPSIQGEQEDQIPLPKAASNYMQVAPATSTTYRGVSVGGSAASLNAALTVVPLTLHASQSSIAAGQSVVLNFTGPNNGSSYFLVTLPENSTIPLVPDSCAGATCSGSYVTPALGSNRTFMVGANGPHDGQAYSQQVGVRVEGGMSLSCAASPITPSPGQPVTISWNASNATSVQIDQGIGNVSPATNGRVTVNATQTTTFTCTATDRFGDHLSARTKVILSTGDVHNLNHIVYLLQENRSFDNYFGELAYYRVDIDHIPGAQLSDVNDLHNLPSGFMLMNSQGQRFPPITSAPSASTG